MDDQTVKTLLKKAVDAHDADDAMKFAQAACNAANALRALAGAVADSGMSSGKK